MLLPSHHGGLILYLSFKADKVKCGPFEIFLLDYSRLLRFKTLVSDIRGESGCKYFNGIMFNVLHALFGWLQKKDRRNRRI